MSVPSHNDVGEQRQRPKNDGELLRRAAVLRSDAPVLERPLWAVGGLTLIEQVENVPAELTRASELHNVLSTDGVDGIFWGLRLHPRGGAPAFRTRRTGRGACVPGNALGDYRRLRLNHAGL